jgi:hypothetical protein
MMIDKFSERASSSTDLYKRRRTRGISIERLKGKALFNLKHWLPQFFFLFTMALIITIVLISILCGPNLVGPSLERIFKFWCKAAVTVTCLMVVTAIHESMS